ncbi:MAG: heparinase II/III family protein [Opitutaceae bacterium]|nr:heparinase II/III family protein [Opitutaceae bacterium]
MHPSLYLTAEPVQGLRSIEDVRRSIQSGYGKKLWNRQLEAAEVDLKAEPYVPSSLSPSREIQHAKHNNADFTICHTVGQRVLRAALIHLLTGDKRMKEDALRQLECVFDDKQWPLWCDNAHLQFGDPPVDLRTGMLASSLSVAYDWLHPFLSQAERDSIVSGISRRAIEPYLERIQSSEQPWWYTALHNWTTCIVGGLGIAGMALGDDHPDSQALIDAADPMMKKCLKEYGPEGEFNESIGYSGAIRLLIDYYHVRRYQSQNKDNRLGVWPFPEAIYWAIYFAKPPGTAVTFGDGHINSPVQANHAAAIASAAQDPVLQDFYLNYGELDERTGNDVYQILCYEDTLHPKSPQGILPLGKVFHAYGKCISNRTSWDPISTECFVSSKAGREDNHAHNDIGQVCIDGYGEPLVIDLGTPPSGYPDMKYYDVIHKFYNYSTLGHNILTIDGREAGTTVDQSGEIVRSVFEEENGALWNLDLTKAYTGVRSVRRSLIHLFPGTIAVLDQAELIKEEPVCLRWHTAGKCEPDASGRFSFRGEKAGLSAQIISLTDQAATFTSDQHEYKYPYNENRLGELYEQRRENYIEATVTTKKIRFLTLFQVIPPDEEISQWEGAKNAWSITSGGNQSQVTLSDNSLVVSQPKTKRQLEINL